MADRTTCNVCGELDVYALWRNIDGDWDGPEEQRPYTVVNWSRHDCPGTFDSGAAVAFGIMGMALEIARKAECNYDHHCERSADGEWLSCTKCLAKCPTYQQMFRPAARDRSAAK